MGKVIALKLTEKEERIVNRLNQEGITSSELLRDALWHYFNSVSQSAKPLVNQVNQPVNLLVNQKVNPVNQFKSERIALKENFNPMINDYIAHLKCEIHQLREQNIKFQKQFEEEVLRLRGSLFTAPLENKTRELSPNPVDRKPNRDIHKDIDEFLKTREKKC